MKLKQIAKLKRLLRNEGYSKIGIWEDGTWADVGSGYGGEQDGNNPVRYISRSSWYDLSTKEVNDLVREIRRKDPSEEIDIL